LHFIFEHKVCGVYVPLLLLLLLLLLLVLLLLLLLVLLGTPLAP
jgi:hypothetical protein